MTVDIKLNNMIDALQTDLRRAGIDVDITFNEED